MPRPSVAASKAEEGVVEVLLPAAAAAADGVTLAEEKPPNGMMVAEPLPTLRGPGRTAAGWPGGNKYDEEPGKALPSIGDL